MVIVLYQLLVKNSRNSVGLKAECRKMKIGLRYASTSEVYGMMEVSRDRRIFLLLQLEQRNRIATLRNAEDKDSHMEICIILEIPVFGNNPTTSNEPYKRESKRKKEGREEVN